MKTVFVIFYVYLQKEVGCAERVMLERMFVSEEKVRLEQDRMMVAQGDSTLKLKTLARFYASYYSLLLKTL